MDELVPLAIEPTQVVAGQRVLRRAQLIAEVQELGQPLGALPGELVDQPGARRRALERLDRLGEVGIALRVLRRGVAGLGELVGGQRVQLVGDLGEGHGIDCVAADCHCASGCLVYRANTRKQEVIMRVFLAGATGAVGRRLVPQLIARRPRGGRDNPDPGQGRRCSAGSVPSRSWWTAWTRRRSARRSPAPSRTRSCTRCLRSPGMSNLRNFDRVFATTNALRTTGLDHLLAAARRPASAASSRRATPAGRIRAPADRSRPRRTARPQPAARATRIDRGHPPTSSRRSATPLDGVVLRYGSFYGPGASEPMVDLIRARKLPLAGDGRRRLVVVPHRRRRVGDRRGARARRGRLQHRRRRSGAGRGVAARTSPSVVGAKPPRRVPVWLARLAAGEVACRC